MPLFNRSPALMKLINKPQIYYPDCDGKPMADNTKQFRLIVMIKENLEIFYAAFMNDVAPTNNGTKIILHHRLHLKFYPLAGH